MNTAAIITTSNRVFCADRPDSTADFIQKLLEKHGFEVCYTNVLPDDRAEIEAELIKCADELHVTLVITLGGTGFSRFEVTPEATLAVVERETRGIPEAMRAAGMQATPRGCLSRAAAGIRGGTLIVNLPGSEKAADECITPVLASLEHAALMLSTPKKKAAPSMDMMLRKAKSSPEAAKCGMFLFHNGVVRETARAAVRQGESETRPVRAMQFGYDRASVERARQAALAMPGIYYADIWLNEGLLSVGDDIMLVLVGGDIRPNVIAALEALVGEIKTNCVTEQEIY